jgi:ankyrin repeat protein
MLGACKAGSLFRLASIFESWPDLDVNFQDENTFRGWTALALAARHGFVHVALKLIERGAQVDLPESTGRTPLAWASVFGEMDVIELLLRHGATVDVPDTQGFTPFMLAVFYNRLSAARRLAKAGANPDLEAKNKQRMLDWSVLSGKPAQVTVLCQSGCDLSFHNNTPCYPELVRRASEPALVKIIKILTAYGANFRCFFVVGLFSCNFFWNF